MRVRCHPSIGCPTRPRACPPWSCLVEDALLGKKEAGWPSQRAPPRARQPHLLCSRLPRCSKALPVLLPGGPSLQLQPLPPVLVAQPVEGGAQLAQLLPQAPVCGVVLRCPYRHSTSAEPGSIKVVGAGIRRRDVTPELAGMWQHGKACRTHMMSIWHTAYLLLHPGKLLHCAPALALPVADRSLWLL